MHDAPATARAAETNGTDVRRRLLDTVKTLFAARGYGVTTTREIVLRAGSGKRTLSHYFASKEAGRHLPSG
jgi:AcrR family transcriptional regulator